ncbi:hypothetical protein ES702_05705 [subsurface metagenome]
MNGSVQARTLEQLSLEMFLGEVKLLLLLYKNGMKGEVDKKRQFLALAKEYFSNAVKGFEDHKKNQETGKLTLTKEAIAADTAFRELSVAIEKTEEAPKTLQSCIQTLEGTLDRKEVDPKDIDKTVGLLNVVLANLRKNYYDYLEVPMTDRSFARI